MQQCIVLVLAASHRTHCLNSAKLGNLKCITHQIFVVAHIKLQKHQEVLATDRHNGYLKSPDFPAICFQGKQKEKNGKCKATYNLQIAQNCSTDTLLLTGILAFQGLIFLKFTVEIHEVRKLLFPPGPVTGQFNVLAELKHKYGRDVFPVLYVSITRQISRKANHQKY